MQEAEERFKAAEDKIKLASQKIEEAEQRAVEEAEKRKAAEEQAKAAEEQAAEEKLKAAEMKAAEEAARREAAEVQRKAAEEQIRAAKEQLRAAEKKAEDEAAKRKAAEEAVKETAEEQASEGGGEEDKPTEDPPFIKEKTSEGQLLEFAAAEAAREMEGEVVDVPYEYDEAPPEEETVLIDDEEEEYVPDDVEELDDDWVDEDGVLEAKSVDASELTEEQLAAIPTASPVRFQGILSLVFIIVLIILIPLTILLAIKMWSKEETEDVYDPAKMVVVTEKTNPFETGAFPSVCGSPLKGTVVYCIDAGGAMADYYTWAAEIVKASVNSLNDDQKLGVIAAEGMSPDSMKMVSGGLINKGGFDGIWNSILPVVDGGKVKSGDATAPSLAVVKALESKPATVVLLVRQKIFRVEPAALGSRAKGAGARLIIVAMDSEDFHHECYQKTIEAAGGNVDSDLLKYSSSLLEKFHN
jgi:chemotaxis protein histidine kinase CheA